MPQSAIQTPAGCKFILSYSIQDELSFAIHVMKKLFVIAGIIQLQARHTDGRRLDSSSGQTGDFVEARKLVVLW